MSEVGIETVRFGSIEPDAPDNFDEWSLHSPNHLLRRGGDHFRAEASFWQLGKHIVTEQRLGSFIGERTAERLAAVPTNQVTLVVVLHGSMTYFPGDGGAAEPCMAGDVVLLDFRRTYSFEVSAGHTVTISTDRGVLEDDLGPLALAGRLPRTPETSMLADFAGTLARHLPGMSAYSAMPAAIALRRLMVMALRRRDVAIDPRLSPARAAALAYIERQPAGRLNVAAMADALGLTRASLYRIFRNEGGVLAYDRRRRLRLLHRSLCEEGLHVPLGDLGAQHGFFDLSNLSRQFKAQFGLSMSDVCKHLLPHQRVGGDIARYRTAIARLA